MNCKGNELVIVVRPCTVEYIGGPTVVVFKPGTILAITTLIDSETWNLEKPVLCKDRLDGVASSYRIYGIQDAVVRPIRGDEGDDETLTWKRTPAHIGEHPKHQVEFAR